MSTILTRWVRPVLLGCLLLCFQPAAATELDKCEKCNSCWRGLSAKRRLERAMQILLEKESSRPHLDEDDLQKVVLLEDELAKLQRQQAVGEAEKARRMAIKQVEAKFAEYLEKKKRVAAERRSKALKKAGLKEGESLQDFATRRFNELLAQLDNGRTSQHGSANEHNHGQEKVVAAERLKREANELPSEVNDLAEVMRATADHRGKSGKHPVTRRSGT